MCDVIGLPHADEADSLSGPALAASTRVIAWLRALPGFPVIGA